MSLSGHSLKHGFEFWKYKKNQLLKLIEQSGPFFHMHFPALVNLLR